MEWQFVVALAIAVPVILFPAAFVWFINISGLYTVIKESARRKELLKKYNQNKY